MHHRGRDNFGNMLTLYLSCKFDLYKKLAEIL